MISRACSLVTHNEAEVSISYLLKAASGGARIIRQSCDDSDVFVLAVYLVYKVDLLKKCWLQMEKWDGTVLDISATVVKLGAKC